MASVVDCGRWTPIWKTTSGRQPPCMVKNAWNRLAEYAEQTEFIDELRPTLGRPRDLLLAYSVTSSIADRVLSPSGRS